MNVLVGYASEHGSTRGIAERLAARLRERGLAAEASPLGPDTDPGRYQAYVLGSAIHSGDWLPEGAEFLRRNRSALRRCPVWVFSVSTVGERTSAFPPGVAARLRRILRLPAAVSAVADALRPRGYHAFAGVVVPDHWGLAGRVFMTGLGGRYGDHRDWDEVDEWAGGIAGSLAAQPAGRAAARQQPA